MAEKFKTSYVADPVTGLRSGVIRFGGKKIETPIRALSPRKFRPRIHLNGKIKGINEIYKAFPSENRYAKKTNKITRYSITSYRQDGKRNNELTAEFERQFSRAAANEVTICFTAFDGYRYPNREELKFLATRSVCYSSDIVPIPVLPHIAKLVDMNSLSAFLNYLKAAVEEYKKQNHRPLMGVIPIKLGPLIVEEALDVFVNNDISAFCVDFGGSTITSKYPDIIDLYKSLDEYKLLDSSLLYSINASLGRVSHKRPVVDAKDIISFGYGFDILGRSQAAPISGDAKTKSVSIDKKIRLFNKNDYGYYRVIGPDIQRMYPEDSSISLEDLCRIQVKNTRNGDLYIDNSIPSLFNIEQQGLEALNLRQVIRDDETEEYIRRKQYVDKRDRKQIFSLQLDIRSRQSNLDTF